MESNPHGYRLCQVPETGSEAETCPPGKFEPSALPLFMTRVRSADHIDPPFTPHDFAAFTDSFNTASNFHDLLHCCFAQTKHYKVALCGFTRQLPIFFLQNRDSGLDGVAGVGLPGNRLLIVSLALRRILRVLSGSGGRPPSVPPYVRNARWAAGPAWRLSSSRPAPGHVSSRH